MPAALALLLLLAAAPARAGARLALVERQVTTLEFDRPVARLAVTDPDVLALQASGARVKVTAIRSGRVALEVTFEDGATAAYDVSVDAARQPAARAAPAPGAIDLAVGEERRLSAPGLARVLLEENGIARVRALDGAVAVLGVSPGSASLVVVDAGGARTTFSIRVR
jgi:hypothetical protein